MKQIKILSIIKDPEKVINWDLYHNYELIRDDNGKSFKISLCSTIVNRVFSRDQVMNELGKLQEHLNSNYGNISNLMEVYDWICDAENI